MMILAAFCLFATALVFRAEFSSGQYNTACFPPECQYPCEINYFTEPCPSCECPNERPPMIMCSPPKCDPPCKMNYKTKPCPSCECFNSQSMDQCPMEPRCDPPCEINYNKKPCPSCECPLVQCALPTPCNPPCVMNYTSRPCPSCVCAGRTPVQCPAPNCPPDTSLFYVPSNLCPVCKSDA